MLTEYADEIQILSRKHVDVDLANQAIAKIVDKLPGSAKKRYELLRIATSDLLRNIGDKKYDASFGVFRFVFFTGLENPLAEARKQGVFRASKSNFNTKLIRELLLELFSSQALSDEELHYVQSVHGLLRVAPDVLDFKNKIIAAIKVRRYFLKTVLSIAEMKYSDLLLYFDERLEKPYIDVLYNNNKESILTAASYLVQVCREVTPDLKLKDSNGIDESTNHTLYDDLFKAAFAITTYLEAEIKVDFFDYEVGVDEARKRISVDRQDFEVAKSCGYTKTDLRLFAQARIYSKIATSKSYSSLLEEFWDSDSLEEESVVYAIKKNPQERIVLKAILAAYGHEANIFSHDTPFREEQMQMLALMDESYNPDVFETKIFKDFTCIDLFKLQRFFGFVAFVYKKASEKLKADGDPNAEIIRRRSHLPVFDRAQLVEIFQSITGKSQPDCEGLLERLTNGRVVSDEVIDLQYRPILAIEHRCLVMPTVFAYSNLWRSLAISESVHFSVFGKHDHMVKSVSDVLIEQGFRVECDFIFGEDEVDIAAVLGEHLFLFECKNPYHPVNDFELRNTYAHIVKGFSQLEKFRNRFEDRLVRDQFLRNMKIEPKSITKVHYGVINANRALSGLSKNGVRVIHANEFMRFVSTGTISSGDSEYACWQSDKFSVNDMISYVSGEILSDDMVSCKAPMPYWTIFRNYKMFFCTFQYDLNEMNLLHKRKYRYLGPALVE